ncbi:MAG: hypothetical protein WA990_02855 [Rubrobacteraceae bacterium]
MSDKNKWILYDNGSSMGHCGTEKGIITRDEEHVEGARITLEEDGRAPFAITCGIYGWMVHTCFFGSRQKVESEYERIKDELVMLLSIIPSEDGPDPEDKLEPASNAISQFVERHW